MKRFFFALNDFGRLRSYVRPFGAANIPLGVMKSEHWIPIIGASFALMLGVRVFQAFGHRPCPFITFRCACQTRSSGPLACSDGAFPYAFANISARKHSPVFIIAQTIRASLLAKAT